MDEGGASSKEQKGEKGEADPSFGPGPDPPKGSGIQVLKRGEQELKLYLPPGKGFRYVIFSIGMGFMAFFVLKNILTSPQEVNGPFAWLLLSLFILGVLFFLFRNLHLFFVSETLEIDKDQLRIRKDSPFRSLMPRIGQLRVFELDELQGVEYRIYRGRSMRVEVLLLHRNQEVEFFQGANGKGKKWVAEYLDRLVKERRGG